LYTESTEAQPARRLSRRALGGKQAELTLYMSEIKCITLDGKTKIIHNDKLILRPAAYAVIIQEKKLLLLKMRHTGKYHLPGGGIIIGERMEETLRREIREETGIEIDDINFARFIEVFFYYDPSEKAYHGLHFYFICKPKTINRNL
jgi:8-oxo-dGTP pyrophosphatase MutT (NUDIX family)